VVPALRTEPLQGAFLRGPRPSRPIGARDGFSGAVPSLSGTCFPDPGQAVSRGSRAARYCPQPDDEACSTSKTIECRRGGRRRLAGPQPSRRAERVGPRQLGEELTQALDDVAADPAVRSIVPHRCRPRLLLGAADLRARAWAGSDGKPDVRTPACARSYHPLITPRAHDAQAGHRRPSTARRWGIGCSLGARVGPHRRRARLVLLPVGLRQHRAGSWTAARPQTLVERVGHARAFQIGLPGPAPSPPRRPWTGGLVNQVVDDGELESTAGALAARLAAGPPGSYAAIKRTINARAYAGFRGVAGPRGRRPAGARILQGLRRGALWPSCRSGRPSSPASSAGVT